MNRSGIVAGHDALRGAVRLDTSGIAALYLILMACEPTGCLRTVSARGALAVASQESVANKCIVIGEDLGRYRDRETAAAGASGRIR
jgi:hypothetical protein